MILVLSGCARAVDQLPDPLPGYARASADERAALVRAVADYYTVRQRAVKFGDAAVVFAAYPKLAEGESLREGINLDAHFIRQMRDGGVTKVTYELERYKPMRAYVKGGAAIVFVQGVEYWHYPYGGPGAGGFFTRIDLVDDAGRWVVERIDEQMMSEPPPRVPSR
ncbi:MAG: hypothetical protein ACRDF9_07815 [Candidatus Limnocylindria bacterium]